MNAHTNTDIASSYALWVEYFDVDGSMSEAEFNNMSTEQKLALIRAAFGDDQE